MKPNITGMLATIAVVGLLSACGGGNKLSLPTADTATLGTTPTGITLPGGLTIPDNITIPAGATLPSNVSVPQNAIDLMIAQFEAAGMKVDKACFTKLLSDDSLKKLVAAGGTPSQEAIQKFFSCITP
jgi:hypothetical protein